MRKIAFVLFIVLAFCPAFANGDSDNVMELVNKAADMFKAQGKDYTLKVLNASAGPLRKGAIYTFAVDFKGRFLSHPVQEDVRGQDAWELQDARGKFIVQDFIKVAKEQGQGWSEYWWIRVGETSPTLKKTYVKRVPGEDLLVAAGFYVK
jgi:signal transduction histidine kinase